MDSKRHGLSVGIERLENQIFLSITVLGKLTHDDYMVITPLIDAALAGLDSPKINALIDATELQGWELRAAWDDVKLGLKHGNEFAKVAIYGHKSWQGPLAKIASWFTSGEVKHFESRVDAIRWLTQ